VSNASGASPFRLITEHKTDGLFTELESIQEESGFISAKDMQRVADRRGMSVREVHAAVTFYPHLRVKPHEARVEVVVCDDMSCHLRGSAELTNRLMRRFGLTDAKDLTFRNVSCLGRCDQAPVFAVNESICQGVDEYTIVNLIRRAMDGHELPHMVEAGYPATMQSDPYTNAAQHYSIVKGIAEKKNFDEVIGILKSGELRGMGGAGFPTNIKWDLVRKQTRNPKYIVCNADESEPGTFKDRLIMQELPHLLIEGMIIAGIVCGATKGYLYIRHEYEAPRENLQREIDSCYQLGILGKSVCGSGIPFDLEIFVSPGGYICGEASALLEAIEGKRAEPRDKPPGTGTHGLWHLPTVLNNVETFAFATTILGRGPEWFHQQGMNGGVGLKFIAISGHVNKPGAFEVPMGITYNELFEKYAGGILGGKKLLGFAPSGPSSGYLPASLADTPMDWKRLSDLGSMVGSAAIVVCAEGTCMLDMALNSVRFFRNESCGKCVPCRMGTQKMVDLLIRWTRGGYRADDKQTLRELSHTLKYASICGLGQIAPVPIESVLKHFPEQIEDHIERRHCVGGVCFRNEE
jgi:NADH:ubiquinone oxidoreductase subunit F (NADH-binding)/NADH:ubiquinone oxidoreductase subunit E